MNPIPPRLATKLLNKFLRKDLAEEVAGDLEEKFNRVVGQRSVARAKLNYWFQVLNYLRPFALRKANTHFNNFIMYQSYFRIGWRNLLRNKGYSAINIGGLASGMAVAMLIGLWIYDELSFNKYHENYETVAQVYRKELWEGAYHHNTAHVTGLGTLLRNEYGAHFKNVAMVRAGLESRVLTFGEKKLTQDGYFMQPEGAEIFSLKMIQGSRDGLRDKNSILLSKSLARKLFGDTDPLNQVISMDAKWELTVTGVYEDLPRNSTFHDASYFAPLDRYLEGWAALDAWDNYHMYIYVQIHPEGDIEKLSALLKDVTKPYLDAEASDRKQETVLHPMREWHLYSEWDNGVPVTSAAMKFVWFYGAIGVFVLVLACINFMNLSTARSEKRAKEVGIRKAIGSYRGQLIQQFFGESLLVSFLSFGIAIMLVTLMLPWFNGIADKQIAVPWGNYRFWLAGFSFVLITGLLAGSYPALYLSSFNPVKVLKGTFKAGRLASVPRQVLVVFQFSVSVCLVIGTIVVYQQIRFAQNRPVGYSREGLIAIRPKSPEYKGKYEVLRNEFKRTGVVEEIAGSNYAVTSTYGWNGGFEWAGMPAGFDESFNTINVTHEYGKTVGLKFIEGRDFSREFATDLSCILLNESAVKIMGLKNPVGTEFSWKPGGTDRGVYKVIGVVKDMVKGSPFEPTDPSVIFLSDNDLPWLYIRIKPGVSPHDALPKIQTVFSNLIPSAPFDYRFADEEYAAKFSAEERVGKLAIVFSVLAILISCSGLFGLASFVAEQRTKEVGIRKVLGASVYNLWQMLSKEFVVLVVIACILAIVPSYWFMNNWLMQYQYKTTIAWEVFVVVATGALAITIVTVSFQAIRAAHLNPVKSLRSE